MPNVTAYKLMNQMYMDMQEKKATSKFICYIKHKRNLPAGIGEVDHSPQHSENNLFLDPTLTHNGFSQDVAAHCSLKCLPLMLH